jgi:hypothetical protein
MLFHPSILFFITLTSAWAPLSLIARQEDTNSTCAPTFQSSRSPYPKPDPKQSRTIWSNLYCEPNAKNESCPLIIVSTEGRVNSTAVLTPFSATNISFSNTTIFNLIKNETKEFTFPPFVKGMVTSVDSRTNKSGFFLEAGKSGELTFMPVLKCIDGSITGCADGNLSRGELATVTACEPVLEPGVQFEGFDGQTMGTYEVVITNGSTCPGSGICDQTTLHPAKGAAGRRGVGWGGFAVGLCVSFCVGMVGIFGL